ncbi:hypothetical protein ACFQZQ_14375 [Lysobacter koreensis]|uniref:Uncharacterized protein n=1 Tax=Lysobacter koreensis TaxID=266122 RepID=A0ABW2YQR6_9GAMM
MAAPTGSAIIPHHAVQADETGGCQTRGVVADLDMPCAWTKAVGARMQSEAGDFGGHLLRFRSHDAWAVA